MLAGMTTRGQVRDAILAISLEDELEDRAGAAWCLVRFIGEVEVDRRIVALGRIVVATYPQRAKTSNIRRDPEVSVCVLSDDFDGPWVQVYGTAEVLDMPEAAEPFVDYFRSIAGEHPDWDEYKQAMDDQGKSLIRITPTSWGPVATGGFPSEVAKRMS